MITFEQIQKANTGLSSISLKDKAYVLVPERVKAFRMLFPEGFILTDILSLENGVVMMKSEVGYYDGDRKVVLGTGMAYEKEANGFVNKTSFIENCETSAVGRALGFLALGIDGGGICSAEELVNAINNQQEQPGKSRRSAAPAPDQKSADKTADDISEIRRQLDQMIKEKTKDLDRNGKLKFISDVIQPALGGERNWKLCSDVALLQRLLSVIQQG